MRGVNLAADLEDQYVTATNDLIAAYQNLASCHVLERQIASTTYAAGTFASVAAADRAIDVACSGVREDISRLTGTVAALEAKTRALNTLLTRGTRSDGR